MRKLLKLCLILVLLTSAGINYISSAEIGTLSPNQFIAVKFKLDDAGVPYYNITYWNTTFVNWSSLGLNFKDGGLLGKDLKLVSVSRKTIDETYPVFSGKSMYARNWCNETKIVLEERSGKKRKLELYFRAYDDGAAFRYNIPKQPGINDIVLGSEFTGFNFAGNYNTWALRKNTFHHNYEGPYYKLNLQDLDKEVNDLNKKSADSLITLPLLMEISPELYCTVSEAAIVNYPGMHLIKSGSNSLVSILSPHPGDASVAATGTAPFQTPWRLFIIGKTPGKLIESNLIMNLNEPCAIRDVSWIKPGKSAWDWWATSTGFSSGFGYGMNNKTIRYYIDFAARNNIEYMTIDAGWNGYFDAANENQKTDLTKSTPDIDLPSLAEYANSKGVGLFIWSIWFFVRDQMEEAFAYYEKIGIKGMKIDIMDRDDQEMVNFIRDVAEKSAGHKLLINFHGTFKPDGISRTYPNLLTREAVMGNEYAKWDLKFPNPDHNVLLPFTRMTVGPMDYTAGSMRNSTLANFSVNYGSPLAFGTRMHQIAMLVVYESPLQTLCDSPPDYENASGFDLVKMVPASWDSTLVLDGKIGEFIVIARKKDSKWFIGGMTNWQERDVKVNFGFLEAGEYSAEIYSDAADANTNPQNVQIIKAEITNAGTKTFRMAKGGGFAVVLTKKDD